MGWRDHGQSKSPPEIFFGGFGWIRIERRRRLIESGFTLSGFQLPIQFVSEFSDGT